MSESTDQTLQAVVEMMVEDQGPGAILAVTAPFLGVRWRGSHLGGQGWAARRHRNGGVEECP